MILDAKIVNNKIYSLTKDSDIISEPLTQLINENDLRKFKNIQMQMTFNQLQQSSDVDVLLTSEPIISGDKLYDLDAETSFVAGTSTPVNTPDTIKYTLNKDLCNIENTAGYDLNRTSTSGAWITQGKHIIFELPNPVVVNGVYMNNGTVNNTINISASNDGVIYTHLADVSNASLSYTDIPNTIAYKFYKLSTDTKDGYLYNDFYFMCEGYSVDISAYSNGTNIPNIITLPSISIIDTKDNTKYELVNNYINHISEAQLTYMHYDDVTIFPARETTNEIKLGVYDNIINELYYEYDTLKTESIIQTDNSTPNTITASSNITASNAYKIFDGDDTTVAYSVACDANGVVDVEHIVEFPTPTYIYKFGMVTGVASNAPKHYIFSGSQDNSTYTTILDITQNISVDNLELTKRYDPSKYVAYKYYKITILEGPASANVEALQYKLYEEKV